MLTKNMVEVMEFFIDSGEICLYIFELLFFRRFLITVASQLL